MKEKTFSLLCSAREYFKEILGNKDFFGELFIYKISDIEYLVSDKELFHEIIQSEYRLTNEQKLVEKFSYINDLKHDLKKIENFELLNDEINFAKYLDIDTIVENHSSDELMNYISNRDISDYLESEGFLVYENFRDVKRSLSTFDILDIFDDRNLTTLLNASESIYGKTGDELKRLLCDIIGCGYYQYSNDDLLNEIKKLL